MVDLSSLSLRTRGGRLLLLDQRLLPGEERWIDASDPADCVDAIRGLAVRGAPLIGVAAALSLAALAQTGARTERLEAAAGALRSARPTAVNLMWAIDRMRAQIPRGAEALVAEAEAIWAEDVALCEAMAERGAALIQDGEGLLTHCNTGGLATAGVGTALGVIARAWALGRRVHVYVDETRPLLQGGRLTAWELVRLGVPHTLITDSMAPLLMRDGRVQRALVGADRIARNGDFANKVGTYGLAVAADWHGVDLHVVAPWSTVDLSCPDGGAIPVEQRDPDEVRGVSGSFGRVRWAPPESPAYNPAFDVTPARLVRSLVLDRAVLDRDALGAGALLGLG